MVHSSKDEQLMASLGKGEGAASLEPVVGDVLEDSGVLCVFQFPSQISPLPFFVPFFWLMTYFYTRLMSRLNSAELIIHKPVETNSGLWFLLTHPSR